jgi:nitrogen fixation/metabolism regulation signal transduction histidine kinase
MDRKLYDAHRAMADFRDQVRQAREPLRQMYAPRFSTLNLLAVFAAVVPWVVVAVELAS